MPCLRPAPAPPGQRHPAAWSPSAPSWWWAGWCGWSARSPACWPPALGRRCRLSELPGILARLRDHAGDPAAAWPAGVRDRLPGPVGMYATLAGILATPLALGVLAWWLHQPPAPPRPPATPARPRPAGPATGRAPGRADAAAARARRGGAVTATTLRAQPTGLTGRGRQWRGRAGTGRHQPRGGPPLRSDPPASTPCLPPCLSPCLSPHQQPWGCVRPPRRCLGWWRRPTPASRAQKPRATGRGLWGS